MREITAYQASDSQLFADEDKCKAHEDDLLGQELDGLLRLFALDISRTQEYKALLHAMKNRASLLVSVNAIAQILEHEGD